MKTFLEVDYVDRVFPLAGGGSYIALKGIDLTIEEGEFISLIGHSGCGKSTLLNIVAGLDRPSKGGVVLEGREITAPGPERMVVFQNYSLLPWKTVRQNIALSVNTAFKDLSKAERSEVIEHHINLVGLSHAADKHPHELSGGMKQRVAIARALAIRPKVLLLDEPFGALDALTRGNLQEQLMQICQENKVTSIMVTHDVDEALLLSDRVVMLTNGPESHIGQILEVNFPRPRKRLEVVKDPSYYSLRGELVYFLNQQKRAKKRQEKTILAVADHGLEKTNLELGFIPLVDCAPLIVAHEKGFFRKYGLDNVTLNREPSWKAIADGVVQGRLDGAQMLAGMPLGITLGTDNQPAMPIVSAMVLSRNGNAITLGRSAFDWGVRTLDDFKRYVDSTPKNTLAMVHPLSMHNFLLRYWLASGGINPDYDVNLITISPAQMVANLKSGAINGYCVGDPWNSRAVKEQLGFVIATDLELWAGHPEKVLGVREDWAEHYPKTHQALIQALLEACMYCDDRRNREEVLALLCRPEYVGTAPDYTRLGFIDPYDRGDGSEPISLPRFNHFFVDNCNYPRRSSFLWILTQMARWNMIPFPKNWLEIIERVHRVDIFGQAARNVGIPEQVPERGSFTLFDGVVFNPDNPMDYFKHLNFSPDIVVQEMLIDSPLSKAA